MSLGDVAGPLGVVLSVSHIISSSLARAKKVSPMFNVSSLLPALVSAISQAAAFESGATVTVKVPTEAVSLDLTAEGLGKVTVSESNAVITFKKA